MCVCSINNQERQRETERQRKTERDRETERQRERERERGRGRVGRNEQALLTDRRNKAPNIKTTLTNKRL